MAIYIILLIFVLCILHMRKSNIYEDLYARRFILFDYFIILFIIEVFRSISVGVDYNMYYRLFTSADYKEMRMEFIEPGYSILTNIAQDLNDFYILPFFVLFIGIIGIYLLNCQFGLNKFTIFSFFILTGIYFQTFDILRQFIAISIICIGVSLMFKFYAHKIIKYLLFLTCLFIAYEFHKSAIVGILFLLLPKIYYKKNIVIYSSVITLLIALSNKCKNIMQKILSLNSYYNAKYNMFQTVSNSVSSNNLLSIIVRLIPIIFQLILLYMFVSRNYFYENYKMKFILSGYLIYLLSSILIAFWGDSLRRTQLYLLIFPLFYSCMYIDEDKLSLLINQRLKKINKKFHNTSSFNIMKILYIIMWIITYFVKLLIDNEEIVPYKFI